MRRYIRLSYNITVNTPLYPGTQPMVIENVKEISKGDHCNTSLLILSNHTGTHIDGPKHFLDSGRTISEYSLEELVFKSPILFNCPKGINEVIKIDDLGGLTGSIDPDVIFIRTGFYRYRSNIHTYCYKNPFLSPDAAEYLRNNFPTIKAIGIDCISISSFGSREEGRETHKILLKEDGFKGGPILLIEDLYIPFELTRLDEVIVSPIFIEGIDSVPCTVIGVIND